MDQLVRATDTSRATEIAGKIVFSYDYPLFFADLSEWTYAPYERSLLILGGNSGHPLPTYYSTLLIRNSTPLDSIP